MTTISQERSKLADVGMRLRRREEWGAKFDYTNVRSVDEPATRIFCHISVTNPGNYSSNDAHARALETIGISRFPSTGISYNRLIFIGASRVYEAQPIGRRGAHTVNDFHRSICSTSGCPGRGSSITAPSWNLNYVARAYVFGANVGNSVPSSVVELFAQAVAADYKAGFITEAAARNIHGHRCCSAKGCPGDKVWAQMGAIQRRVNQLIDTPPPPPEDDHMSAADVEALKKYIDDKFGQDLRNGVHNALIEMGRGDDKQARVAKRWLQNMVREALAEEQPVNPT